MAEFSTIFVGRMPHIPQVHGEVEYTYVYNWKYRLTLQKMSTAKEGIDLAVHRRCHRIVINSQSENETHFWYLMDMVIYDAYLNRNDHLRFVL